MEVAANRRQSMVAVSGTNSVLLVSSHSNISTQESLFKDMANCLIRRLFGSLGNLNMIKDPLIHKRVFEFIHSKWDRLAKVSLSRKK